VKAAIPVPGPVLYESLTLRAKPLFLLCDFGVGGAARAWLPACAGDLSQLGRDGAIPFPFWYVSSLKRGYESLMFRAFLVRLLSVC
jgi:hypothetical protein